MGGSLPETMSAGSNDEEFYGRRQQKWIIQPKTEAKWWNIHRIGWWENLQESPIFDGKTHGFL